MPDSAEAISRTSARMHADRARVLLEINNAIVSHLDLAKVLNSISACLRREIKHDFAAMGLYDSEKNELRLHALDFPADQNFMTKGQLIPLVGTPAALAFSTRKPVLRHRLDPHEFPHEVMKRAIERGIKSGIAVPLLCHDKIVGSLALASLRESAFTEDDVELLTQIAAQVAIAVDNAQNFESLRRAESAVARERDRTKLLLEINNAVVSDLDLRHLLKSISASLRKIMHHDSAFLGLCDSDCNQVQVQALDLGKLGDKDVVFGEGILVPLTGTPEGQAIASRQPVVIASTEDLRKFSSQWVKYAIEKGIRSACACPLVSHGRSLGVLTLVSLQDAAFTSDDAQLLAQCSSQIAIAVENALNFEKARQSEREARQERDRSELLLDINNALVSHLDLYELVTTISASLKQVLPHDFVGIALYDAENGKMFVRALDSECVPVVEGAMHDAEGSVSGLAFSTGKPIYLARPDPERFPSPITQSFIQRGLKTLYAVPMIVHGRKLGVLVLSSFRENAFTESDQELFQQITKQVSIATANALSVKDLEALKDRLAQEKLYLEDEIRTEFSFDEIIGQSAALREVLKLVQTVSASDSTVLLLGETGTGKELIARAIHDHSRRQSRTFVKLNCAAIPTGLLESELFGHEKGAFTGAIAQKIGRLELADQGTLFLDEVGDIPVEIQPKLLRALQEREFERLGSTYTKKVNVRLVAATNRDLEQMMAERQFRSDLYYRLNVFPIRIPPLRDRPGDIPLLVRYFVEKFSRQMQKSITSIPATSMVRLQAWHWPGNIRELENLIERSVILSNGKVLEVPLIGMEIAAAEAAAGTTSASLKDTEREHIINILRETKGVLAGPNGAAFRLGLKRTTLQSKMKKLGITRDQWLSAPPSPRTKKAKRFA